MNAKTTTSALGILALGLVLAVAVWTGYRGIDFGKHWDEHWTLDCTRESINTGHLIAARYEYPSVTRDLALLCAGPGIFRRRLDSKMSLASPEQLEALNRTIAAQANEIDQPWFTWRVRTVFMVISLASCVWVYLLVLASGRDWKEALLAATLLGSSWQVAYHARWIAPDAILMQFSALTLLFAVLATRDQQRSKVWLGLAAVAAGLGCSTKYAGAVLLLPVLVTAGFLWQGRKGGVTGIEFPKLAAFFLVAFILTTTGAWVDPGRFLQDILVGVKHYHAETHWGNTIHPGGNHLWLMLEYLCLAAFSKYPLIAIVCFAMIFVGAWSSILSDWKEAAILTCAPLLYVGGFALQRVMNVRNLLLIFPVLAVLSARGTIVCIGRLPWRAGRVAAALIVALACALNLIWLVRASEGIAHRAQIDHAHNIETYLRNHSDTRFYLSDKVSRALPESTLHSLPNLLLSTQDLQEDAKLVFFSEEGDWAVYPANHFGYYDIVSGTYEVDYDYYPGWLGDPRVLAVPVKGNRPVISSIQDRLGVTLIGQGKFEEAVSHFADALRIDPNNAAAHNNLGLVLVQAGKFPEAIAHYEQALRLAPDFAEAHYNLGLVLEKAGRMQEAIDHYNQALRIRPNDAEVHYSLGVDLFQTGKTHEGIDHVKQAIWIKPDYAKAHSDLGIMLVQMSRVNDALGQFEEALRITPDDAVAQYNLGLVLKQTGRIEEAITHFQEALRIRPDYPEAQAALEQARIQSNDPGNRNRP